MAAKKITDVQLKAWARKSEPLPAQALGGGLYFRIHGSGANQFYFRYMFGKKGKWHALGLYPDVSLREAKDAARECRVKVKQGIDPSLEKQRAMAEQQAAKPFGDVADDWFTREIESKYKHPEVVERVLRIWIKPTLGKLPPTEITPVHVDKVLQAIVAAGSPTVANDALRFMQRIFKYARKRRLVEINPIADFDLSDAGGEEKSRERYLSVVELRDLLKAMRESESFGRSNELSVKLLLVLCVRKMELLSAKWADIDLDAGLWYLRKNKTEKAIEIPLPTLTVEWLRELRVLACGKAHVFPARRISRQHRLPHVGTDTLNRALDALDHGLDHFTVHDLRRTARTHLSRLGVSWNVAERCLNHKIRGVQGTYDRHDYFDERMAALTRWADDLLRLDVDDHRVIVGTFSQAV